VRVAALVDDLLDRSKLAAAVPAATFAREPGGVGPADVIVVDLAAHSGDVVTLRARQPAARIVAYGRHTDTAALAAARAAGADRVLARSAFFRDPAAAVAAGPGAVPPSGRGGSGRDAPS
jgi:DNA-binding NarL/FixJ family response regulator